MKILIAGGSGFVGKALCRLLLAQGHTVTILTRHPEAYVKSPIHAYYWNVESEAIDLRAFDGVEAIINLAGENVGARRWSTAQKLSIQQSRVAATRLLHLSVARLAEKPKVYLSASAVGFYGLVGAAEPMSEGDAPGDDFLAKVCRKWETQAAKFSLLGIRTCCVRTGVVLSKEDGALKKILASLPMNVLFRFGSGEQPFPWIHVEDLCRIYLHLLNTANANGIYNGVAPARDTFNDLLVAVGAGRAMKPWIIPIPKALLRLLLGEMSVIVTEGVFVSSNKIQESGFRFNYPKIMIND